MPQIKVPTDDPSLPSYERPEFRAIKPSLWHLMNCWVGGFHHWKADAPGIEDYLPKKYLEEAPEYQARLRRSRYHNQFRSTIEGFSGAFSKFELQDSPLDDTFLDNADRCGSSFKSLLDRACSFAARDKYGFWFPQFYKGDRPVEDAAEEARSGKRPYVTFVQASQVPNWEIQNGAFVHVTLIEKHAKKKRDYGTEYETLYRTIRKLDDGSMTWALNRLIPPTDLSEEWQVQEVNSGLLVGYDEQPLSRIPIVPFSVSTTDWDNPDEPFPFLDVADLCVYKFQVDSDRRALQHSLPSTIVIAPGKDAKILDRNGNMSIGPGTFINVGNGGTASILEPTGKGIEYLFTEADRTDEMIRSESLRFMQQSGPEQKEVQVKLSLQDLQNALERRGNLIESSVQSMLSVLGEYVGKESGGRIVIAVDLSVFLSNVDDIAVAVAGHFLSQETAIERMQAIGYVEDAEVELARVLAEQEAENKKLAQALKAEPVKDEDLIE